MNRRSREQHQRRASNFWW